MVEYYKVLKGRTLIGNNAEVIGKSGDVVKLDTDSPDKKIRHSAEGILMGQWSKVAKLGGAPNKPKPKPNKKTASYKTTEATPEG